MTFHLITINEHGITVKSIFAKTFNWNALSRMANHKIPPPRSRELPGHEEQRDRLIEATATVSAHFHASRILIISTNNCCFMIASQLRAISRERDPIRVIKEWYRKKSSTTHCRMIGYISTWACRSANLLNSNIRFLFRWEAGNYWIGYYHVKCHVRTRIQCPFIFPISRYLCVYVFAFRHAWKTKGIETVIYLENV